ncbi:MAG: c-type cytochrome biogenesis protein CcsB [Erysipelotrichaceae bacterium]|nr:c-type cytochrome biogenesis protein CcsB [Erysipelotrichaceae bacterium]
MLDILFFAGLVLYFVSMTGLFVSMVFHQQLIKKYSWYLFLAAAALATVYLVIRGIKAGRLPMSNQFEFACSFSWGIAMILIFMHYRLKIEWIDSLGVAMAFLILSYAALQPREITELMPALRSAWFGFHIGSAAFSYAAFMLAGAAGVRYLLSWRKNPQDPQLVKIDYMIYRLIAVGLLLLTVTILSGAIWAEEAWSSFWTWDPKEVWALITWILYAIFLHLRLGRRKSGVFAAWYAIIAVPVVLFTFVGVNTLLPGLHSYGVLIRGTML